MEEPIIEPWVFWVLHIILCVRLLGVFVIIGSMITLFTSILDGSARTIKISAAVLGLMLLAEVVIPPTAVTEKLIIAHYSRPEIMDRFESYEAFYNELGYELKEGTDYSKKLGDKKGKEK